MGKILSVKMFALHILHTDVQLCIGFILRIPFHVEIVTVDAQRRTDCR